MNIENVLKVIQDFRAAIEQWGVTTETLIAVAGLACIMFIFSLREVLTWFLRVHTLRDDIKGLRHEITELKALMQQRPLIIEKEVAVENATEELKKKDEEKTVKAFRLDH